GQVQYTITTDIRGIVPTPDRRRCCGARGVAVACGARLLLRCPVSGSDARRRLVIVDASAVCNNCGPEHVLVRNQPGALYATPPCGMHRHETLVVPPRGHAAEARALACDAGRRAGDGLARWLRRRRRARLCERPGLQWRGS